MSTILDALVKSKHDSTDDILSLEGVDNVTFWRFFQFVYSGAYESPDAIDKDTGERFDVGNDNPGLFSEPALPFSGGPALQTAFKLPYSMASYKSALGPHSSDLRVQPKRKGFGLFSSAKDLGNHSEIQHRCISLFLERYKIDESTLSASIFRETASTFVSTFMCHVKTWLFAKQYAIPALMDYTCPRLARELAQWEICASDFIRDFKELVRYVHNYCAVGDCSLRLLIARFATCAIEDVSTLEGWTKLLAEVPTFEADLGLELLRAMQNS